MGMAGCIDAIKTISCSESIIIPLKTIMKSKTRWNENGGRNIQEK